jgi:hypothetical protein
VLSKVVRLPKHATVEGKTVCVFWVARKPTIFNAVDAEIEFLKRNDPECSKLAASGGHAHQNVHRTLMMIALIDFTFNRYRFSSVNLQCATIMRSVYPVPHMFDGIEEFFKTMADYSFAMFLEKSSKSDWDSNSNGGKYCGNCCIYTTNDKCV